MYYNTGQMDANCSANLKGVNGKRKTSYDTIGDGRHAQNALPVLPLRFDLANTCRVMLVSERSSILRFNRLGVLVHAMHD